MQRNLDPAMAASLMAGVISPVLFAMLTFRSGVHYACNAGFDISFGGNTYKGVGSYGRMGLVTEGTEVEAGGLSLELSAIDPEILGECLTDIAALRPAKVWVGFWANGALIGQPYCIFAGVVDKPTINLAPETATISLALESRMHNLNRSSNRRYTRADQNANGAPNDSFFDYTALLSNLALRWGE